MSCMPKVAYGLVMHAMGPWWLQSGTASLYYSIVAMQGAAVLLREAAPSLFGRVVGQSCSAGSR
jgi:hypothetical protein